MVNRKFIAVILVIVVAAATASADGLFDQSQTTGIAIDGSYTSQLGFPSVSGTASLVSIPTDAVLQAIGDSEYPVTPGDTFTLSYMEGKNLVTLKLQADSDCKVAIQSIGVVDAAGMTYGVFKDTVENLISTYYTFSSPQLQITGCGIYSVRIYGEVSYSQYVTAWGLSRLSDLAPYATDSASTRAVEVTYRDGSTKTYDLFNALRNGVEKDNPLLAPGCQVRFPKASTIVSLDGAVSRAGVYQSLEGETLYDLIQNYGGGLLGSADSQSIKISNYADGVYYARSVSLDDAKTYVPANGDAVTVQYSSQNLPYVTVMGSISPVAGNDIISSTNRARYSFIPGETAQQLLGSISSILNSTSDVSSAYVLRDGRKIRIAGDPIALEQGDSVVIPFSSLAITVTGYVQNPGTFEYIPGMTSDYYIALAGGFTNSASGRVKVTGIGGGAASGSEIPAGATIQAKSNNLATTLSLTATVVSLVSSILLMITYGHTVLSYF